MAHVDQVSVEEFLNNAFDEPVYVQLDIADYNKKADGGEFERYEFYRRPDLYVSKFSKNIRRLLMCLLRVISGVRGLRLSY